MEALTTADAAELVGVTVQKFHRLANAAEITPVIQGAGIRGPKFWKVGDVAAIARAVRAEVAA
jgi:hypothetical protein